MIDIHSHLIPDVDDGSRSIEETIEMIKEAQTAGYTDIVLTPHYMEHYFETDVDLIKLWKEQLQKILVTEDINVNLHIGNEVYISEELDRYIKDNKVTTLAGSKYLLVELPLSYNVKYLDNILFKLKSLHITPIIAHPERYNYAQINGDFIQSLIKQDCLIQCNLGSLVGKYGKQAEKTIKYLLRHDLVDFLGTDTHRPNSIYAHMSYIMKELKKNTTEEQLFKITVGNPKKVLNNEEIKEQVTN